MLEDSLWESSLPTISNDEYTLIKSNFKSKTFFNKQETIYNKGSRKKKFRFGTSSKSIIKSKNKPFFYSTSLFTEDSLPSLSNISKKNFKPFIGEISVDLFEDAYENLKNVSNTYNNVNKSLLTTGYNLITPTSYTHVLNSFRDNYQEFL